MHASSGAQPVLTVLPSDDLPDILENIRRTPAADLILDYGDHRLLRDDPLVRRLIKATAADFGKRVTFQQADRRGHREHDASDRRPMPARGSPIRFQRRRGAPKRLHALRSAPWPSLTRFVPVRRTTLAIFAVGAGMLLIGVVAFVLPRARVHLVLATEPFAADFTVWFDTSVTEPQSATGTHPARILRVEEAVEREFPVETIVEKGARSSGVLDLVNETGAPQGIKGRTRLRNSSGITMRTQRDVIVPPRGRAPVAVQAEEGGSKGNLTPQRLTMPALPVGSQRLLFAEVVRPLRGGTDQQVHELASADVERGSTALRGGAEQTLRERIAQETATGSRSGKDPAVFTRPELTRITTADPTTGPAVGTEAASFRLRTTVRGEALLADRASLQEFVATLVRQRAGADRDPVREIALDDLTVVDVRWDHGRAEFSLHVETPLMPRLHADELRERLEGRTAEDAAAFLRAISGVRSAEVDLSPVWVKRIPAIRRNIHIEMTTEP